MGTRRHQKEAENHFDVKQKDYKASYKLEIIVDEKKLKITPSIR